MYIEENGSGWRPVNGLDLVSIDHLLAASVLMELCSTYAESVIISSMSLLWGYTIYISKVPIAESRR